jgi:hypothetical protein
MSSPPSSPERSLSPTSNSATPPRKVGRPDELGPYKREFMGYHLVAYKTLFNARKKDSSLFITGVARAYVALFGRLPFKEEPLTNPGPSPSLDISLKDLHQGLNSEAEIEEMNKFTRDVRKVSRTNLFFFFFAVQVY